MEWDTIFHIGGEIVSTAITCKTFSEQNPSFIFLQFLFSPLLDVIFTLIKHSQMWTYPSFSFHNLSWSKI